MFGDWASDEIDKLSRKTQTYPFVQCAAVMTHSSLRSVPPQFILTGSDSDGFVYVRPTCQPISPLIASSPPTIRWTLSSAESSRFVTPSLFWPHTVIHFDLINYVQWERIWTTIQLTAVRVALVQEGEKPESFQNQHACLSSDALIWTERGIKLNIVPSHTCLTEHT